MTGRIPRLPMVVSFHPETGLIIPVSVVDEVSFLLKMAKIRDPMVATEEASAYVALSMKKESDSLSSLEGADKT